MRIIAVSDLHMYEFKSKELARKTIADILNEKADVLIIGGDIAKTKNGILSGLEKFSKFDGIKLAYAGNHEISALENMTLKDYSEELSKEFESRGFHLLDKEPFIHNGVGFVGNVGWFDYSLHNGEFTEKDKENVLEFIEKEYHSGGILPGGFTEHSTKKIREDLRYVEKRCEKIVLGIHFTGFREFLLYGKSEYFDFKNALMGSEVLREFYSFPKVKIGFCGHTHRSGYLRENDCEVYNISMDAKFPFRIVEI